MTGNPVVVWLEDQPLRLLMQEQYLLGHFVLRTHISLLIVTTTA